MFLFEQLGTFPRRPFEPLVVPPPDFIQVADVCRQYLFGGGFAFCL